MKKCKICDKEFKAYKTTDKFCSPRCALADKIIKDHKKKENKKKRDWKERKKKGLEELKTHSEYQKDLQKIINSIARKIDYGNYCISCGGDGKPQAGHYHSVGSNNSIRFNLHNIHIQDYYCNVKLSANIIGYNKGLMKTYGKEYKEYVENQLPIDYPIVKMTRDKLKEVIEIAKDIDKGIYERHMSEGTRIRLRDYFNEEIGIYKKHYKNI